MLYAEYVQQIEHLPFNIEELSRILNDRPIEKWSYLVHDKDEHEDGSLKSPHVHVEMQLKSNQKPDTVASWFSDKKQYINKATGQNKKYMYQNMCLYLIHDVPSADGKYKYDVGSVISNFDFALYIENAKKGIEEAKKQSDIDEVLIKICNGEISRMKIDDYLSELQQIKYSKRIEEAYKIRDRRLSMKVDRMIEVMYFYGPSETGKTTWAKEVARMNDYTCYVSGASNDMMQSYMGQECIVIDETRGENWQLSDLLKFLDNHTASMAKARYHNKLMTECRLVILTSTQSLDEFFNALQSGSYEERKQLKRRITTVVEFSDEYLRFYTYNSATGNHEFSSSAPNITRLLIGVKQESKTVETMLDYIISIQGKNDTTDFMKETVNQIKNFGDIAPNEDDLPFTDGSEQIEF